MNKCSVAFIILLTISVFSCGNKNDRTVETDKLKEGRVLVSYWEKWSGFEKDAMAAVVDKFNRSQDKIYVDLLSISSIDRKMIVASASGNPPDLAGLWTTTIPIMADKNALEDLTLMYQEAGVSEKDFIKFYWDLMSHRGRQWGVISTPATIGLHWNKRLFREAGLNPNLPPVTIAELDDFSDKATFFAEEKDKMNRKKWVSYKALLTKYNNSPAEASRFIETGQLTMVQAGFLPSEPGWWPWFFGYLFGGTVYEEPGKITFAKEENIEAYRWVQSFMKKYGARNVKKFSSGFGNFSSPQNAFLSGKVAIVFQGVWMYNFIDKYSPGMEWGAAPLPVKTKVLYGTTLAEGDVLVIPKGAKNKKEAFEFIKFLVKGENMELVCLGQRKFSPLSEVTADFYKKHPHPYIRVFRKMAESPNLKTFPRTGYWNEYVREIQEAYNEIWNNEKDPAEVFPVAQKRAQKALDLELEILKKRGKL